MVKDLPPVERNQDIALTIDALGSEGQGIGRVNGYTLFVPGALQGERVNVRVIKPGKSYGVGKLLSTIAPSEFRAVPSCPLFGRCGGCTLQHMQYAMQLTYKRQAIQNALERIGGLKGVEVLPVVGMEQPYAYRNKGSFPIADLDGKAAMGFYAPRSHRLIPFQSCDIQRPQTLIAACCVLEWANAYQIPAYEENHGKGLLRHVIVREAKNGDTMVIIVATGPLPQEKALLTLLQQRVSRLKSVYLNINRQYTNVIQGDEYRLLFGAVGIEEELCGLRFQLGPASFLQVNTLQAERLYTTALDMLQLTGAERVVDAYCGIGAITLMLARQAKEVVGIESVSQAVENAICNAANNGVTNASFICADAGQAIAKLLQQGFSPDIIVMDPPRKGADEAFLNAIISSGVERVLYISCDPGTLARDCKILHAGGYEIEQVRPFDMFPQTVHVETIVLLKRQNR